MELDLDCAAGEASFLLQSSLYPEDVIAGAARVFAGRAEVWLDEAEGACRVTLGVGRPESAEALEALAGEFLNEMLAQALRRGLHAKNGALAEQIVTRAFLSSLPPEPKTGS